MPSAQVIDFGRDATPSAIGSFAKGFGDSFAEGYVNRQDEDLFESIKKKYGPNAKPTDVLSAVVDARGFEPEYKRNLIKDLKDISAQKSEESESQYEQNLGWAKLDLERDKLAQKENNELTPYQKKLVAQREADARIKEQRINQSIKTADAKLPKQIADYTASSFKNVGRDISQHHKIELDQGIERLVKDGASLTDATQQAVEALDQKLEFIDSAPIPQKPVDGWLTGADPKALEQSYKQTVQQLIEYRNQGITSQKDLRAIAKRGGWDKEQITQMLQTVLNKKIKAPESTVSKEQQLADEIF